ncbi:hypothetical protein SPRG_09920 [Saprolegnia parasitica CBS 223.65]|uniref:Acyltransferase n=1 Tax=Saprolegnia parasitica (strain CBS 223.65) TaxID=695850 RepID=A0A067C198_SAPPC|nr:hypothetical protein SPRG_09920 [Saprolegnia parasitica CBS 223.65]KDO24283.1 hypothetical protein SPRG_09920 [Saprolegnia parasitica CBS 223.65]|eukprot:XP_012205054.1 hypothetical protein SPRG_09920 [Saprolegnia parasitica CBS 223.65]
MLSTARDVLLSYSLVFGFYTLWMVSMALAVASVPVMLFSSSYRYYVLAFHACYFSYRYLFPLSAWPSLSTALVDIYQRHPYYAKQDVVFDEGAAPAKGRSKTLMAYHPHGILCCGWLVNGGANPVFRHSNFSWLVTDLLFLVPGMSNLLAWFQGGPAGRTNFERLAKAGDNIAIIPGGFEEATIFARGHHRVFLKNRKGFLKLALQYGYKVHPVYTFGEEETYASFPYLLKPRVWLNKYKVPGVIFRGLWFCFYMPFRSARLTTVVGAPLQLPTIDHPTIDDVTKYHNQYMAALQELFDKYKGQYATDPNAVLELF